jgi:hypothetical protein
MTPIPAHGEAALSRAAALELQLAARLGEVDD